MSTVALPTSLDAQTALAFTEGLSAHASEQLVIVDFASVRSVNPFGLLVLVAGAALRTFFRERKYHGIAAQGVHAGEPAHEYLAHIGFFQWIGVQVGKTPGAVPGGATWLPVTTLTQAELDVRMVETGKPLGIVIHQECDRLARLLTQTNQLKVNVPLAYCLREVIRNVFEHAEIDRCVVCALKSADGSVEVAVVDQGRGIRRSLEERFQFRSDEHALRSALSPGVTRRPSTDRDDQWGNSGFGLFVLSQLGRELGVFRVVSGGAGLRAADREFRVETAAFSGTAIQLRFRRPKGTNLAHYIESIIERGEVQSEDHAISRASKSTRSLI